VPERQDRLPAAGHDLVIVVRAVVPPVVRPTERLDERHADGRDRRRLKLPPA
jgi:hypothetical protein